MKVLIDLATKKIVGFERPKNLFEFEVEIFDASPEKVINNQRYYLLENPSVFNLEDVIEAKGKKLIADHIKKFIVLNEELNESDLDLQYINHKANTGLKFLQLRPNGECKTTEISLPEPSTSLKVYIEAEEGISTEYSLDGESFSPINDLSIELSDPTEKVFLKFVNSSDEHKQIFSYGILI